MAKYKFSIQINLIIPALVGLVVGSPGYMIAWLQHRDSQRANLIAYIRDAAPGIRVVLDNGAQSQTISGSSGYFRFQDLQRGWHELAFQRESFPSYSQPFVVTGFGDNSFGTQLALPTTSDARPLIGPLLRTIPLEYSDDGSDPLVGVLIENLSVSSDQVESGWVEVSPTLTNEDLARWKTPDFDKSLHLDREVVLRASSPVDVRFSKGWKLGIPVGKLPAGQDLEVMSYKTIEGSGTKPTIVWAEVRTIEGKVVPPS